MIYNDIKTIVYDETNSSVKVVKLFSLFLGPQESFIFNSLGIGVEYARTTREIKDLVKSYYDINLETKNISSLLKSLGNKIPISIIGDKRKKYYLVL